MFETRRRRPTRRGEPVGVVAGCRMGEKASGGYSPPRCAPGGMHVIGLSGVRATASVGSEVTCRSSWTRPLPPFRDGQYVCVPPYVCAAPETRNRIIDSAVTMPTEAVTSVMVYRWRFWQGYWTGPTRLWLWRCYY